MSEILTSLRGRRFGLSKRGNLITNREDGGIYGRQTYKQITSAQLLALFATPITVVAAPAAGFAHIVRRVQMHKPAGTAYAGIAAGEDLVLKYTNASGAQASGVIEATGFLDSATVIGEIITGDSVLHVLVSYDTVKLAFTA